MSERSPRSKEEVRSWNVPSRSCGILQAGLCAARMNSNFSFSFSRVAISDCREDFSSSRSSVSAWRVSVSSRRRLRHLAAAILFLSRLTRLFSSSSGESCSILPLLPWLWPRPDDPLITPVRLEGEAYGWALFCDGATEEIRVGCTNHCRSAEVEMAVTVGMKLLLDSVLNSVGVSGEPRLEKEASGDG